VAFVMLVGLVTGACAFGLFWVTGAGAVHALEAAGATYLGVATVGVAVVALLL
jgi:hypothetical protein